MWINRHPCQILIKLEFSRQIFEEISNTSIMFLRVSFRAFSVIIAIIFQLCMCWKIIAITSIMFHQNPSSGSRVVPYEGTNRHDAANSRVSKFCETGLKTYQNSSERR
jgi:hypothetical protein